MKTLSERVEDLYRVNIDSVKWNEVFKVCVKYVYSIRQGKICQQQQWLSPGASGNYLWVRIMPCLACRGEAEVFSNKFS